MRLIKERLDGGIIRLTLIMQGPVVSHVNARRWCPTCQNIDELHPISNSDAFHFEAPRLSPLRSPSTLSPPLPPALSARSRTAMIARAERRSSDNEV